MAESKSAGRARCGRLGALLLLLAIAAGLAFSLALVIRAHSFNGRNGFPLDDPWIHLTYARNLHEHHEFAYFPGDPPTQGSTSPLYTMLLALGFSVTGNEKVLSYALGLLFHALFLATLGTWARMRLGGNAWAAAAVFLVGLNANIGILSVSGMETSLFLFLMALAFVARIERRWALCGIALGLLPWVRPDGLILTAVFGIDGVLGLAIGRTGSAEGGPRDGDTGRGRLVHLRLAIPIVLLAVGYFLFNVIVGGAALPNTFAAKTAAYRINPRISFIRGDSVTALLEGGWLVLTPLAILAIANEAIRMIRRERGHLRLETGWAAGLWFAYFILMPYAHRFGRYLIPAVPALTILGLSGLRSLSNLPWLHRSQAPGSSRGKPGFDPVSSTGIAIFAVLVGISGLQIRESGIALRKFPEFCTYHYVRHERTGLWLAANTPSDAVVATHDVGAIAYYSRRRTVDVAGVVLPEAARHVNAPGYVDYLLDLFARSRVTHLAVLRNWLAVDNVAPLFVADPRPEVMEVYAWIPGKTHLVPPEANALVMQAGTFMRLNEPRKAIPLLEGALRLDSRSERSWFYLGGAWDLAGQPDQAVDCYRRALSLMPEADEARLRLAAALAAMGRTDEARRELDPLIERAEPYPGAMALRQRLGE